MAGIKRYMSFLPMARQTRFRHNDPVTQALSSLLVVIHGAWRWIVLASAISCVARFLHGAIGRRLWTITDRRWAAVFVGALDVQLTLGLFLFVSLRAPAQFAAHAASMIGAVALAHWGNLAAKRAPPEVALKWAAPLFGCASIVIIAAIPWSRPLLRL
jgi:hypothetical protein